MEEEINQLKSILRSLVVSSPTEVNVRVLLHDYREMMGAPVPFRKFGYKDPLIFFKERCSDCFLFTGPPSNPVLTLIVPETLKHIDAFVQKQKSSNTTKHKTKRRSVPHSIIEPPKTNLIFESFINKKRVEETSHTAKPEVKSLDIKSPVATVANGLHKQHNHRIEEKLEIQESNVENINKNNPVTKASSKALHNFLKKRMPLYESLDDDKFSKENESSKDDIDSGRQTLSSKNSILNCSKFEHLKGEIREVIADNPEGVMCSDLMRLYRERYKKELEFSRWGYTSIVSVVYALGEAVSLARLDDSGDWLARDARAARAPATHARPPRPPRPPRPRRLHQLHHASASLNSTLASNVDDALPGVQYDSDVFPKDCMQFQDSLLPAPLTDVRPGMLLEVMVGEVYSPSHFWLMRLGKEYHLALDEMMDEMNEYYERGEGRTRELARGAVRAGQYCASRYERHWHRALVVRELDADCVKVRLVDYGTVEQASWRALRALPRRWGRLPQQALRARLAGVAPRARHWPRAASRHLLRRVQQRHLVAQVAHLHAQENILEVFLIDTSGEDDVCLSTEMIRSGHAEPRADSSVLTSEWHLYPRFDALETGATPNFGDIEQYLRDGIALQFVEDYRRHVPVDLPPSPSAPPTPPAPSSSDSSSSSSSSSTTSIASEDSSPIPSTVSTPRADAPPTRIPLLRADADSQTTLSPLPHTNASTSPPLTCSGSYALKPTAAEEVRLSLLECEMYRELCASSPMAAHWFLMGAMTRALQGSSLPLAPAPHPAHSASSSLTPPLESSVGPTKYEPCQPHDMSISQEPPAPSKPHPRPLLPHSPYESSIHGAAYPPYGAYPPHTTFGQPMPHPTHGPQYVQFEPLPLMQYPMPRQPLVPSHPPGFQRPPVPRQRPLLHAPTVQTVPRAPPGILEPPPGFESPVSKMLLQ